MATSGPNFTTNAADDATVGTSAWATPANAKVDDGVFTATATTLTTTVSSHYLNCTGFGFSIPVGATINGILVEYKCKSANSLRPVKDTSIRLIKGGVISGNNNATAAAWTNVVAGSYQARGGSSDLWGLTLAPSDVNASNFGVVISAIGSGTKTRGASIDAVRMTVTYTGGAVANTAQGFMSDLLET